MTDHRSLIVAPETEPEAESDARLLIADHGSCR